MQVKLKSITPDIETNIVEIARVSSSRKDKSAQPEGLINYLIKNYHLSPFEHGFITLEIETSKAIGIQLIRHRSFTFQELSQRYADIDKMNKGNMFEHIEVRKQAVDNRQSSEEVFNPMVGYWQGEKGWTDAENVIRESLNMCHDAYNCLIEAGVAREQARMILPMATKTKIYMTGNIRSWLGFLNIRLDHHAQVEIRNIANMIADILQKELPLISKACNNFNNRKGMFL